MAKERTTVSVSSNVLKQARERDINISEITEKAIQEAMKHKDYYFINSNRDVYNDPEEDGTKVYEEGITATHGPEKFGEKLRGVEPGDVIFHWVNKQGVRAEGRVTGYWDGRAAPEEERVQSEHREYHLPTRWLVVLDEDEAVSSTELEEILGRSNPRGTKQKINDEKYNCERLQEVIRGRAVDY